MKAKKHPKANLENYSKLFAQLGLVLTLTIVYVVIQSKTFTNDLLVLNDSNVVFEDETDAIIEYRVEPPKKAPIPKKVTLEVVKQVENEAEIIESFIDVVDVESPVEISDIVETEPEEAIIEEVPFILIEDAPEFPGCTGTKEEKKACFISQISKFVGANFDGGLASELGLDPGVKRISVLFKIDKVGNIVDVQARAPHKKLQKEAIRVVALLPKMEPGKQRGNPVTVKYALPIVFKVE
ncbi:energy transducer TonB [Lutibacter holmesii]|uniref:Energy transducer TonB n=1 Tax=Lutibacter holmesii TaxID=1137985 RepID=A0ABW3WR78_9FLAO